MSSSSECSLVETWNASGGGTWHLNSGKKADPNSVQISHAHIRPDEVLDIMTPQECRKTMQVVTDCLNEINSLKVDFASDKNIVVRRQLEQVLKNDRLILKLLSERYHWLLLHGSSAKGRMGGVETPH